MRTPALLLSLALLTATAIQTPVGATTQPDLVPISIPAGTRKTRPPVTFTHTKHDAIACTTCHHTWDGQSPLAPCASPGCHDLARPHSPEEKSSGKYFRRIFHSAPGSCVRCHESKRSGEATGPVKCRQCHLKS